jgi:hypothetical protein
MSSSSPQLPDAEGPRRRSGHPRFNRARMVLVWLGVIVLAVSPWPWW